MRRVLCPKATKPSASSGRAAASWIDLEKTYDGTYGLVTEEKDGRDNATTYTYETNNLYVATSTNAKGHTTGYVYDYSIGKPKRTNDPHNLIFEVTYDALDRVTAEKQPDLTTPSTSVTKTAYTYTDTVGSRKVEETHNLSAATSTERITYLDGLDRPIQERTEHEELLRGQRYRRTTRSAKSSASRSHISPPARPAPPQPPQATCLHAWRMTPWSG